MQKSRHPIAILAMTTATILAVSAVITVGIVPGTGPTAAHAENCTQFITHWGRIRSTQNAARDMARAGLNWKVNTKLRGKYTSTSRILQCKRRSKGWQCKAGARVNLCV